MKIVILGDIHGRTEWKKIIEKESPDLTVFLGDYVSTHELISPEQQWENMLEILELPNATRLRGNHDVQHLGYYWAECSEFDQYIYERMSKPEFVEEFLSKTQWLQCFDTGDKTYICSHAGISQTWFDNMKRQGQLLYDLDKNPTSEHVLHFINDCEPDENFGFTPDSSFDYSGTSKCQPLTWIRPQTLCKDMLEGYGQIVGHTPVKTITNAKEACKNKLDLWLCDRMPQEYLYIKNGNFYIGDSRML